MMSTVTQKLSTVLSQIRHAEHASQRRRGAVQLLAVSKTKPVSDIITLYQAGQRHFAESYLQEALQKQHVLGAFDICWHFIGPIQSNKTQAIAHHFTWVHSVDRLKIAQRLSAQRPQHLPPLNICLQVNISNESTKSGIQLAELPELAHAVRQLPNISLRGVMAIPLPQSDFDKQCLPYRELYQSVKNLNIPELDSFSFGMSDDLKAAIQEGATLVRIGTALFGKRDYP